MKLWTFGEVNQKIRSDLDLQEEDFILPDEMVGYCNEAIHEAESEILKINEDYFLSSASLTLVVGTSLYSLPSSIYAQKIRGIMYVASSTDFYPVKRIRGGEKFDDIVSIQQTGQADDYRYLLMNSTAGAQSKIMIVPPARDAGALMTVWFIRSAQRVLQAAELTPAILPTDPNSAAQLATVLDIPEFTQFIIDFMKCRCLAKDSDPRYGDQVAAMENQRKMMIQTLTEQVPDDDNTNVMDLSFYSHHS